MPVINISKIRLLREQKGWEQKELAAKAGVNPAVISRLERGTQQDFKISVIAAISLALDVSVDEILNEQFQHSPSEITSQLNSAIAHLSVHPSEVQNRMAAIVEAYLSSLEKEV